MEKYNLPADLNVFGFPVDNFPAGIKEAFDKLIQKTGDCAGDRAYYGLSEFKNGKMIYYALAEEKFPGEANKYYYEKLTIDKGDYLTIRVSDWQNKTGCIKDFFSKIIQDSRVNKSKPAIEWYRSDTEMICLVQMK